MIVVVQLQPDFKLPLPGGLEWRVSQRPGDGSHAGRQHYTIVFDPVRHGFRRTELVEHDVPVLASTVGVITESSVDAHTGEFLRIDHGHGFSARYGHLQPGSVSRSVGDRVAEGDTLGIMGTSGETGGLRHLHFEIRYFDQGAAHSAWLDQVTIQGHSITSFWSGYYLSHNRRAASF